MKSEWCYIQYVKEPQLYIKIFLLNAFLRKKCAVFTDQNENLSSISYLCKFLLCVIEIKNSKPFIFQQRQSGETSPGLSKGAELLRKLRVMRYWKNLLFSIYVIFWFIYKDRIGYFDEWGVGPNYFFYPLWERVLGIL